MSERGFGATLQSELSASPAHLALLVELQFTGGTERLWSGVGDITYGGYAWTGAGELGSIDKIADSVEKSDTGVELVLDYLDDDIRNEVITNDSIGEAASIYLAVIDPDAGTVTTAYEVFPGFIDQIEIVDSGETGELRVRLASELARLKKPQAVKLTDAAQQYLFSGDVGLEFAARMDEPIAWGRKTTEVQTTSVRPRPYEYPITGAY